jgi:hypothetical protein
MMSSRVVQDIAQVKEVFTKPFPNLEYFPHEGVYQNLLFGFENGAMVHLSCFFATLQSDFPQAELEQARKPFSQGRMPLGSGDDPQKSPFGSTLASSRSESTESGGERRIALGTASARSLPR